MILGILGRHSFRAFGIQFLLQDGQTVVGFDGRNARAHQVWRPKGGFRNGFLFRGPGHFQTSEKILRRDFERRLEHVLHLRSIQQKFFRDEIEHRKNVLVPSRIFKDQQSRKLAVGRVEVHEQRTAAYDGWDLLKNIQRQVPFGFRSLNRLRLFQMRHALKEGIHIRLAFDGHLQCASSLRSKAKELQSLARILIRGLDDGANAFFGNDEIHFAIGLVDDNVGNVR